MRRTPLITSIMACGVCMLANVATTDKADATTTCDAQVPVYLEHNAEKNVSYSTDTTTPALSSNDVYSFSDIVCN